MKCRRCRGHAVIEVRRHNAAFCPDCFTHHCREQVRRAIDDFDMLDRDDRVLVAVSGGKDSLALWHLLHELGVPLIPRMISEYAHERTGADIHPGATIGYVPQEPHLTPGKSVLENVEEAVAPVRALLKRQEEIGEAMGDPDADFDKLSAQMEKVQAEIDATNAYDLLRQMTVMQGVEPWVFMANQLVLLAVTTGLIAGAIWRARRHVEHYFSLDRMVGDSLAVYAELLRRAGAQSS